MRILHIIDSLVVGGAEKLLTALCPALKNSGTVVEVYALRGGGALEADLIDIGVPVHVGGLGSVYSPLHVFRLARFMKSGNFDIIHAHLFPAQLWVALAAALVPNVCPIVTTEHSTRNRRRNSIFRGIDKWMYHRFRAVISISEAVRTSLTNSIGSNLSEFHVVNNGIDLSPFRSVPRQLERAPDHLTILSVGNLRSVKDHATLLRALARLKFGKLLIAGDGELRDSLQRLAVALEISERVQFLGCRDDVPVLMASADVYVQPSRVEGFGLAPLEAMAAGLPVITSDAPGMMEVVEGAGLTFPVGDAEALANLLREVLSSADYRAQLSEASRQRAALFSIDKTVKGYQAVYDAVLSPNASAVLETPTSKDSPPPPQARSR